MKFYLFISFYILALPFCLKSQKEYKYYDGKKTHVISNEVTNDVENFLIEAYHISNDKSIRDEKNYFLNYFGKGVFKLNNKKNKFRIYVFGLGHSHFDYYILVKFSNGETKIIGNKLTLKDNIFDLLNFLNNTKKISKDDMLVLFNIINNNFYICNNKD
ncbi:MAG: hypothetical protein OHK0036_17260 [Bacteroidia bacterium]